MIDAEVESKELDIFLENFDVKLEKACQNILNDLAEKAFKEMSDNYSKAEHQASEGMDFSKVGSENEKIVSMSGPQAWYSEFGTGTQGEINPHPLKGRFDLKPYNSGETIRSASKKVSEKTGIPEGTLYWTYKDDSGKVHYTQGIPAQKEVYNAGVTIQKEMKEIVDKNMKGMFK